MNETVNNHHEKTIHSNGNKKRESIPVVALEQISILGGYEIDVAGTYIIIDADNVANENELNNSATLHSKVLL
jgi:hypothetical protein